MEKITVLNPNTNFLKLIAAITMLIDHIGYMLFPDIAILRIIGRISYPLFSYTLMIGYFKTSNLKNYFLRLFVLAVICQIPYFIYSHDIFTLNILFTLSMQLLIFYSLDKKKYYILLITLLSFIFHFDYNILYIPLTILLYYTRKNKVLFSLSFIILYLLYSLRNNIYESISYYALLSLPFLLLTTHFKIRLPKYFFYLFYPLHMALLYIVQVFI